MQGKKLVLFITGLCAQRCFYCPISEQKFGKDVVYANEWKIASPKNPTELFEEANLINARGAGITGGDPLMNVGRCCHYITQLKKRYGASFHIHLYTPLRLVTKERLHKLYAAGLDEIRFHPNLDDDSLWHRLRLAGQHPWTVGIEIPAIPGYEAKTKKLIDYITEKCAFVKFINFNELELSDTQILHYRLHERGYLPKSKVSYGVALSKEMALAMVSYAGAKGLRAHFCTAKLKDAIQVGNRLKRRAESIALPVDTKTKDGLLIRGCIYLPELAPCFGYRKKLAVADKENLCAALSTARQKLRTLISDDTLVLDTKKMRIITSQAILKKHAAPIKKLGLVCAIVEELPTEDALETDVQFL